MSPEHPGSEPLRAGGVTCASCHEGRQAELGASLVKHPKLEPDPIAGKRPTLDLSVRDDIKTQKNNNTIEKENKHNNENHTTH